MSGTRFMILFSGRSGGTLLQRSLNNHPDIRCDGEIVQDNPWPLQVQIMDWALGRFEGDIRACGFKTKLFEYHSREHGLLHRYLEENGVKLLHLYRRNVVKHALSHYIGNRLYERTKAWEIYDENERITPLPVDLGPFRGALHYIAEWERRNFMFACDVADKLQICYEDMSADKTGTLARVQEWLGVPVRDDLVEPMKKVTPDDLGAAITDYREFALGVADLGRLPGMREWTYLAFLDRPRQVLDWLIEAHPEELNFVVEAGLRALDDGDGEAARGYLARARALAPENKHVAILALAVERSAG
jgi:LPS sulfotransferase NodH